MLAEVERYFRVASVMPGFEVIVCALCGAWETTVERSATGRKNARERTLAHLRQAHGDGRCAGCS